MRSYEKIQKICFYGVLLCLNTHSIASAKETAINYLTNDSVPKQLSLFSNAAFLLYGCTLVWCFIAIAIMKGKWLIAMAGFLIASLLCGFIAYYYFVPQLIICGFLLLMVFLLAAYAANMKKLIFIGFIVMFVVWTPAFLPPIYIHW